MSTSITRRKIQLAGTALLLAVTLAFSAYCPAYAEQTGSGASEVYVDVSGYGDRASPDDGNEVFQADIGNGRVGAAVAQTAAYRGAKSSLPKTGDSMPGLVAGCATAIAAASISACLACRRKENDGKN